MLFLNYLDNLLYDAYIIFQKGVDNFEIEYKTSLFLVSGVVPSTGGVDTFSMCVFELCLFLVSYCTYAVLQL